MSDPELFAEAQRLRTDEAEAEYGAAMGMLIERWRRPAIYVIRKVLASYRRDSHDDEDELFQEAARRLLEKGMDQYRGISEVDPGRAASPKTFFLRIAKHLTIDHCRKLREELAQAPADGDEAPEISAPEASLAKRQAQRASERADATEVYWRAYERLAAKHPKEAEAWDLYHHQELGDHEACAQQLGITVANSYKRVSRAQAHLRLFILDIQDGEP